MSDSLEALLGSWLGSIRLCIKTDLLWKTPKTIEMFLKSTIFININYKSIYFTNALTSVWQNALNMIES